MKKLVLLFCFLIGALTVHADDYAYLAFETTSGWKVSVPVASLTISISGTTLTAGGQSFALTDLSKMYFSASDETTGIDTLTTHDWDEAVAVYDLNGRKVEKDQAKKGVYIVKTKQGTHKIVVQ